MIILVFRHWEFFCTDVFVTNLFQDLDMLKAELVELNLELVSC